MPNYDTTVHLGIDKLPVDIRNGLAGKGVRVDVPGREISTIHKDANGQVPLTSKSNVV